jgi:cystathionine gamma-lyase/cystathionine gamma-lyase/homocysteine desulfhydrase
MVFFETPTNPFLRTVPIRDVASRVGADTLVVVDNTWATELHQKPLELGATISLHSATKYFGGHSDVLGGLILSNDAALALTLREERFYSGVTLDPHSSWLIRRSLQTLPIRMAHHVCSTRLLADFLKGCPQVRRVYEPHVDGEQMTAYGGIIFIELAEGLEYSALASALKLFTTGTGMAAVSAMVAQPCSGSHASLTDAERSAMGIGPELVRLCFGLEDPEDLRADLARALETISS